MICGVVVALALSADGAGLARKMIDEFKFAQAVRLIAETVSKPTTREHLIRLYELEGIAWSATNRQEQARAAFARLLTLDPEREPPAELSPRGRTTFFAARTLARREPLTLTVRVPGQGQDPRLSSLTVSYQTSQVLPATTLRFTTSSDGGPEVQTLRTLTAPSGEATLELSARSLTWTVEVLDRVGSVLASANGQAAAQVVTPPPPPPPELTSVASSAPAEPGLRVRPAGIVLAAVGVAAAGVGVGLALLTASNRGRLLDPPLNPDGTVQGLTQVDAVRMRDSLPVTGAAATGLLIGGALSMVGGVLLAFLGVPPSTVSAALGPTGGALLAHWSF